MATELEIMRHAKNYLDQLANGRNPLTGDMLPDTDIVNNVRISRCLFYASDILRQVIEKGGLHKQSKSKKPLSMTAEQIQQYQYYNMPVALSAISSRLNESITDPDMRKFCYRDFSNFLEAQGYLRQMTDAAGKMKREPTDKGIALGMSIDERTGPTGDYTVILYNRNVQRYLLEHLQEIIEAKNNPSVAAGNPENAGTYTETIDLETGEIIRS